MTLSDLRPSRLAGTLSGSLAALAAALMFLLPYASYGRNFNGAATLLMFPGWVLDLTGFAPENLPEATTSLAFGWAVLAALLVTVFAAVTRARWLWVTGLITVLLTVAAIAAFEVVVGRAIQDLIAQGVRPRRITLLSAGANIALFLPILAGVVTLVAGLSARPAWYARLNNLRGALVPIVAIGLSIVVGALVVLFIQPIPTEEPVGVLGTIAGKADIVWFVYASLFSPLTNLGGFFQSLMLATPLIFTGLSVAFAFRAGLFNIGAPGQLLMGAIFAMLVGVYLELPAVVLLPLSVMAAAAGGAFWGAIPGVLKARFGASEVIITIMLNYIASSIFIFLIGSNTFPLFGREYTLPFKAPGFVAQSYELQPGARLPSIPGLLGLESGETAFLTLAPLAAILVFVALYFFLTRNRRRIAIAALSAAAVLLLGWAWLGVSVEVTGSIGASRLNLSFVLAVAAAVFFAVFMWRTAGGYAVRAVGLAPKAAEYGGISVARNTILAMVIAGAFAGLASTHYVLGGALDEYRLKQDIPATVGFDGITVALLGQSTPVGVVMASVLFGTFDTGGVDVDLQLDEINKDIVTVLKALVVLFIAAGGFLSRRVTAPPAPLVTPNLAQTGQEMRESLGLKDENDASEPGAGPQGKAGSNPQDDGRQS